VNPRHLFRATCATGGVIGGILAVLNASAYAAGEPSPTATLTSPTGGSSAVFTWSYEGPSTPGVGFCDPAVAADVELASQQYTRLDSGVTGTISATFGHEHAIDPHGLVLEGNAVTSAPGPGPCPE
jgi:hypothetical protein